MFNLINISLQVTQLNYFDVDLLAVSDYFARSSSDLVRDYTVLKLCKNTISFVCQWLRNISRVLRCVHMYPVRSCR
jgi:hypothetical protein